MQRTYTLYLSIRRTLVLLAAFLCSFWPESFAQEQHDILVRNGHAMVYNLNNSTIYLFGGADEKEVHSDLHYLEGSVWRKVSVATSPKARTFTSLVNDYNENRLILFGGNRVLFGKKISSSNLLNDTWQFKNRQWVQLKPKNKPTPRAEASMVYNPVRKSVLLFGGYTIVDGAYIKLGDTWEFHDGNWSKLADKGPTPRHGATMVFNSKDNVVFLFGGSTKDRQYGPNTGETWTWNGTSWQKVRLEQPPGMYNATMVFDSTKNRLYRFGGWNGEQRTNGMWVFAEDKWEQVHTPIAPACRNHSAMVYDKLNDSILLYGGHDGQYVFNDLWEFKNDTWKKLIGLKPIKRLNNGH